jgi:hypothetical protein
MYFGHTNVCPEYIIFTKYSTKFDYFVEEIPLKKLLVLGLRFNPNCTWMY